MLLSQNGSSGRIPRSPTAPIIPRISVTPVALKVMKHRTVIFHEQSPDLFQGHVQLVPQPDHGARPGGYDVDVSSRRVDFARLQFVLPLDFLGYRPRHDEKPVADLDAATVFAFGQTNFLAHDFHSSFSSTTDNHNPAISFCHRLMGRLDLLDLSLPVP